MVRLIRESMQLDYVVVRAIVEGTEVSQDALCKALTKQGINLVSDVETYIDNMASASEESYEYNFDVRVTKEVHNQIERKLKAAFDELGVDLMPGCVETTTLEDMTRNSTKESHTKCPDGFRFLEKSDLVTFDGASELLTNNTASLINDFDSNDMCILISGDNYTKSNVVDVMYTDEVTNEDIFATRGFSDPDKAIKFGQSIVRCFKSGYTFEDIVDTFDFGITRG